MKTITQTPAPIQPAYLDLLSQLPPEVISGVGIIIVALIGWGANRLGARTERRKTDGDHAIALIVQLREGQTRLEQRVLALEGERSAYRSWAHVLWAHIHDEHTPRIPSPIWPSELPR